LEALEDRRLLTVTVTVGPNINTGNVAGDQVETTIAVNPTNPDNLFAASNNGYRRYSMDGGATWLTTTWPLGTVCCDMKAAFDKYGNLFVSYLDGTINADLALSTDGGANFTLLLNGVGADYPGLATGPDGAGFSSVWIMYWAGGINQAVRGAQVTGLGAVGAFTAAQTVAVGQFGDIAVGRDGRVTVTGADDIGSSLGPSLINVATDFNGLAPGGFSAPVTVVTANVGTFTPIPAEDNRTIHPAPTPAYSHVNGRLFLVYTDRPSTVSDDTDIYVQTSDNGGLTWRPRIKLNDDGATGKSQFFPDIAVDQTTSFIAVTWYDCRNSANNDSAQIYGVVSAKRGAFWEPNIQIGSALSNANVAGSIEFGDYDTMDYTHGRFYRSWADNASPSTLTPANTDAPGDQDLATARVDVVFTPSPIPPHFGKHRLRPSQPSASPETATSAPAPISGDRPHSAAMPPPSQPTTPLSARRAIVRSSMTAEENWTEPLTETLVLDFG
jgi:hypothetical protein